VDLLGEYERLERERPRCLPALELRDLGLGRTELTAGAVDLVEGLLSGRSPDPKALLLLDEPTRRIVESLGEWNEGCRDLDANHPEQALARFERAARGRPEAPLYALSSVLALTSLKRFALADERLAGIAWAFDHDVRYAVVSALLGAARGDLERAEAWLREPAEDVAAREAHPLLHRLRSGVRDREAVAALAREFPDTWRQRLEEVLVSEQYYYVLLWRGRFDLARDYALRTVERYRQLAIPVPEWLERAGDAAFHARELKEARLRYEQAEPAAQNKAALWLKLSDIAFLEGDLAAERALRERYYGSLD
jgi:hypothetical protein